MVSFDVTPFFIPIDLEGVKDPQEPVQHQLSQIHSD